MKQKLKVPLNPRFLAAFAAVSFLSMGAHELIHHFTGRLTCGAWGAMTFSHFFLAPGCGAGRLWLFATLMGPVLTHALIWTGAVLIHRGMALAGFALIFANLPLARFVTVLIKGGDEMVLGRTLFGDGSWPVLLALTVALLVPPLVIAFRALAPGHRKAVFAGFLVLPLFWDLLAKRVLLGRLLETATSQIVGIPVLFMVTYAVAALLLLAFWPRHGAGRQVWSTRLETKGDGGS